MPMLKPSARRAIIVAATTALLATALPAAATQLARAVDPGVRTGAPGAGGPLPGLDSNEANFFDAALAQFQTVDSVSGALPGEAGGGLGPRFNSNFCGSCHAYPAIGGSSPPVNPQVAVAILDGALNTLPPFISQNGPVREARFIRNPDGSADGGVHDLFVISGRSDAPGCAITQPDFAGAIAQRNLALRIPTAVFGLGMVENTPDAALVAADAAHLYAERVFGITGHFNRSANDGTITRFGWKAQNKSLLIFAGEAYTVEQGVTNELFPNEREDDPNCQFNALPEDATFLTDTINSSSPGSDFTSGTGNFAAFMRLSAPPVPAPQTEPTRNGQQIFAQIGCEACHFASQTTAASIFTNQSNLTYQPFSDFKVHSMGAKLADGITQGNAAGDQFRTAPLWGLGQRLFFLHDGRTADLVTAVEAHDGAGSEARHVIDQYNTLPVGAQQDLLNFLRSL